MDLACIDIYAQPGEFLFRHLNTSDGLSNNMVNCIIQDSKGYMWFGTDEGLNRYDGYEIKVFEKRLGDTTSIASNKIISLFIDSHDRLWVGTINGLCLYDADYERFRLFLPETIQSHINNVNRVVHIQEGSKQDIYVTTEAGQLYVLRNDALIQMRDFSQYGHVMDFIIDKAGYFWIGTNTGVIRYDVSTDKVALISDYYDQGSKRQFTTVLTIIEDQEHIWIGTNTGQLASIRESDLNVGFLPIDDLSNQLIMHLQFDANHVLHVSTSNGLYLLDRKKKITVKYNWEINNPFTISSEGVNCIYYDRQYNLWVGTTQGINLSINGKDFKNYNRYSQNIKLDIASIRGMAVDSKGNLWLGSNLNGINIINPSTGYKKLYLDGPETPKSITESSVIYLFKDSKNNIWIGTYLGHLLRFDPLSQRFVSYDFNHLSNGLKEVTDIRSMVEDKDGNYWFISHGFGLFKFNLRQNSYRYFARNNDIYHSLADDWAFRLVNVDDSILWIATPSGLSKFNIYTESFRNYYYNRADSASLSNDYVNTVFCDSRNNIWIGTLYGLNLYCKKTDSFYHFYEEDGLSSNQIRSFIEERPGRIWMGTGDGLTCMDFTQDEETQKPEVKFRNYNLSDNLQDIFFWENSAEKLKTGELIFGTEKGIVMFNPEDIKDNMKPPDVYITEIQLFNKKVNIGDFDSLLIHDISRTEEIKLKHKQNVITFKYVAINYIAPEKNQYAYKMDGFDADWNYVGNKREVTFTNMAPGTYTFNVKASNNDGIWNETGASISVRVLPPWWKTWWFQLIVYFAIVSFLLSIYYLRMAFYRNQQKKLSRLVKERTSQLEEAAVSMEEKQEEINSQKEELTTQRDELENANQTLVLQKEQILDQHIELEKHRNELELLVEERTKELIEAKDKAEESDRLKSSFLANLSHEIRTPLNVILGFTSLLGENDLPGQKREEYNKILQDSSNTLLELINDILDISKIEAGQMKLSFKPVRLNDVLSNMSGIFDILLTRQFEITNKQVLLKINIEETIQNLQIVTDKLRLEQVLSNLISNALKFTEKGYIEIGCTRLDDANLLEFYVKDTGIGIREEHLKLIFERFRKVEEDKSHIYRGTGLGLAISTQLINLMGGTMYVKSKVGEGSVFYFTLPLVESETPVTQATVSKRTVNEIPDLTGANILVAEDDILNFNFIARLLKKTNANVIHAENGKRVLELMRNNHEISLILMDIKMPEMDGIEALRELQKMGINVTVIAQTAYAFADDLIRLKNEGFKECISKPINSADFYRMVSSVMLKS